MKKLLLAFFVGLGISAQAQYWQQAVHYNMDITMDVANHQYDGTQQITYTNNSPDTLRKGVFPPLLQRLPAGKHDGRALT
jgi:hypothetical protein